MKHMKKWPYFYIVVYYKLLCQEANINKKEFRYSSIIKFRLKYAEDILVLTLNAAWNSKCFIMLRVVKKISCWRTHGKGIQLWQF